MIFSGSSQSGSSATEGQVQPRALRAAGALIQTHRGRDPSGRRQAVLSSTGGVVDGAVVDEADGRDSACSAGASGPGHRPPHLVAAQVPGLQLLSASSKRRPAPASSRGVLLALGTGRVRRSEGSVVDGDRQPSVGSQGVAGHVDRSSCRPPSNRSGHRGSRSISPKPTSPLVLPQVTATRVNGRGNSLSGRMTERRKIQRSSQTAGSACCRSGRSTRFRPTIVWIPRHQSGR